MSVQPANKVRELTAEEINSVSGGLIDATDGFNIDFFGVDLYWSPCNTYTAVSGVDGLWKVTSR